MGRHTNETARRDELRALALSRLQAQGSAQVSRATAGTALGVLYQLASAPSTAADALTLLHELQVHQVELELQAEELRASRLDLEANLSRQMQLYDWAPVGLFTVDRNLVVCELNQTGARLLDCERDAVLGRPLSTFLTPGAADTLGSLLARIGQRQGGDVCTLELAARNGAPQRRLHASVGADPAGPLFLVALAEAA